MVLSADSPKYLPLQRQRLVTQGCDRPLLGEMYLLYTRCCYTLFITWAGKEAAIEEGSCKWKAR